MRDRPWPVLTRILIAATASLMRLGSLLRQAIWARGGKVEGG